MRRRNRRTLSRFVLGAAVASVAYDLGRKLVDIDLSVAAFQHQPFGNVAELADVAWPLIRGEALERLRGDFRLGYPMRL